MEDKTDVVSTQYVCIYIIKRREEKIKLDRLCPKKDNPPVQRGSLITVAICISMAISLKSIPGVSHHVMT